MINDTFVFNKQLSIILYNSCEVDDDYTNNEIFAINDNHSMVYVPLMFFSKDAMQLWCLRNPSSSSCSTFELQYHNVKITIMWTHRLNSHNRWLYRTYICVSTSNHLIVLTSQPFNRQTYNRYVLWLEQNNLEIR